MALLYAYPSSCSYQPPCLTVSRLPRRTLSFTPPGSYKVIASGQAVTIHPSSVLSGKKPECIVFNEMVRTTRQYARDATVIEALWLPELAPAYFARQHANAGQQPMEQQQQQQVQHANAGRQTMMQQQQQQVQRRQNGRA